MVAAILSLDVLAAGMPGIGPKFGAALAEAAVVSLQNQTHASGVQMVVDGDFNRHFTIQWHPLEDADQANRTWGDAEEATEHGAYGLAALLVSALTEWTVVERARKGAGFDYWLGLKDAPGPLFQGLARLEISGIGCGTPQDVHNRVDQKVKQISKSKSLGKLGIVAIIEFSSPTSRVVNA